MLSVLCIAAYPNAIKILKLMADSGLKESIVLFGAALIPAGFFQIISGYWVYKSKWEGILLARCAGSMLILTGSIITIFINRPDIGLFDFFKGIVIFILSFLISKKNIYRDLSDNKLW